MQKNPLKTPKIEVNPFNYDYPGQANIATQAEVASGSLLLGMSGTTPTGVVACPIGIV